MPSRSVLAVYWTSRSSAKPRRRTPVNDETRKLATALAAAIFAPRALTEWDGKLPPKLVAGVHDAVEKAKFLVSAIEGEG